MRLIHDERKPVAWLNFRNSVKPDPHTPVGPNRLNEYYWPVESTNDGRRIGYSLLPPKENT